MILAPEKTAITDAEYTKITVDATDCPPGSVCDFSIFTEDAAAFLVSNTSDGTANITIPANTAWNTPIEVDSDGAILYAKGTTSTKLNIVKIPIALQLKK